MRIERHDGTSVDLEYMLKLYLEKGDLKEFLQPLINTRFASSSVKLDNKIYVIGGLYNGVNLTTIEYLDLDNKDQGWQVFPYNLNTGRRAFQAVVHNNKIYVIGGIGENNTIFNTIEYLDFDNLSQGWQILQQNLNYKRFVFSSNVYNDKIYVVGGKNTLTSKIGSMEILDLNNISTGWELSSVYLNVARSGSGSGIVENKLYVFGGENSNDDSLNTMEILDLDNISTGWELSDKTLNTARRDLGSVVINDTLYAVGGFGYLNTIEILDLKKENPVWENFYYLLSEGRYLPNIAFDKKSVYIISGGSDIIEYFEILEINLATGNIPNTELLSKITVPTGFGKEVDMVNCSGGSNSVNLEVFNKNEVFSKFIAEKNKGAGLYKRKCELYQVTSNNKTLLFTGVFNSYKPVDYKGMKYQIQIADYMSEYLEKETLFYSGYDADGVRIYAKWWDYDLDKTYEQNIAIKPANDTELNVVVDKYLNSDSAWEVKSLQFEYDQLDPNNSKDAERMTEITQEIKEIREEDDYVISLKGHPLNVARFLIKQMFNVNATWNETSWNLAQADTDEVVLNKSVFELNEYPSNVMDYMSENIFRVCNVYPYINKNGELCIRKQKSITALQDIGLYTITRNEMIDIKPMTPDYDKVINHIMIKRGTKNAKEYFTNSESIINHGMKFLPESVPELVIPYVEIDAVPNFSNEEVISVSEDIKDTLFRMFSTTYHEWELTVSMTDFSGIEIMDTVALQNELLIDPETGERGFDESVESLNIYATWNNDVWGEYLGTYEGQQVLDADLNITTYYISEIISDSWYNSVINANFTNSQYADDVVL